MWKALRFVFINGRIHYSMFDVHLLYALKEFFTIKMVYFRHYFQYSSIPLFHFNDTDRLPLINLYFQKVVESPKPL